MSKTIAFFWNAIYLHENINLEVIITVLDFKVILQLVKTHEMLCAFHAKVSTIWEGEKDNIPQVQGYQQAHTLLPPRDRHCCPSQKFIFSGSFDYFLLNVFFFKQIACFLNKTVKQPSIWTQLSDFSLMVKLNDKKWHFRRLAHSLLYMAIRFVLWYRILFLIEWVWTK